MTGITGYPLSGKLYLGAAKDAESGMIVGYSTDSLSVTVEN